MAQQAVVTLKPDDLEARDANRLMTSIIVPRPIAWVSTINPQGITNLAPFSFFNAVSGSPPTLMVSVGSRAGEPKDTLVNIKATGEFVVNLVDEAHAEIMNLTSGDWAYGQSEIDLHDIETLPSLDVKPPRVAGVPAAIEVKMTQLVPVKDSYSTLVLGQVQRYHIREDLLLPNGLVDSRKMNLITRLGGAGYARMGEVFEMERPVVSRKR